MHHPTDRTTELLQLLNDIVLAIAAMDHDWQAVIGARREMSIEPSLLFVERGAVPVSVEAGFSDGDDTWASDHLQDGGQSCWPTSAASLGWMPTAAKIPRWAVASSSAPRA